MIDIKNTPGEATTGFPFPLPILLVRVALDDTDWSELLEGTLVRTIDAFSDAIYGLRAETVLVAWSSYAATADSALVEDTRRQLVDWINSVVVPRTRAGRRPVWM